VAESRMMIVGDVMPGQRECVELLGGIHARFLADIFPLFDDVDFLIGNLELPLTSRGYPAEKPVTWRTSPQVAPFLARIGFDALTLANNHTLDYGIDGLLDTVEALEQAGIAVGGAGKNLEDATKPVIRELGLGIKIAVVAVTCSFYPGSAAAIKDPALRPFALPSPLRFLAYLRFAGIPPIVKTDAGID